MSGRPPRSPGSIARGPGSPPEPGSLLRRHWPLGVVPLVAMMIVVAGRALSPADRVTNLDIGRTGFSDTYLMFSKTSPGRCYVVNRRESTVRRSDEEIPARMRDCRAFGGGRDSQGNDLWLVQSKRKGTTFFVPAERVPDWTFPFVYRHLRDSRPQLDLPATRWTQLFVNRHYSGLYLQVDLPYDKRRKDGRTGELREILTARGARMTCTDTRFQAPCRVYPSCVALGVFPELEPPSPALAWLADRRPFGESTVLLSDELPGKVRLLPLPVSLDELWAELHGRSQEPLVDERFLGWDREREAGATLPPDQDLARLRKDFEQYAVDLLAALRTHGELHRNLPDLAASLPRRQSAVSGLGLRLGAL